MRYLYLLVLIFLPVLAAAQDSPFDRGVLVAETILSSHRVLTGKTVRPVVGEKERVRLQLRLESYPPRVGHPLRLTLLLMSEDFDPEARPGKLFYSSEERLLEGGEDFSLSLISARGQLRIPASARQFESFRGVVSEVNDPRRFVRLLGRDLGADSLLLAMHAVEGSSYHRLDGGSGAALADLGSYGLDAAQSDPFLSELEERFFRFEDDFDRLSLPIYWQSSKVAGYALEIPLEIRNLEDPLYLVLGPLRVGRGGVSVSSRSQGARYFPPMALRVVPSELKPYSPKLPPAPEKPRVSMFRGDAAGTGISPGPPLTDLLQQGWRFKTGAGIGASAALVQDRVLVSSQDGFLYALDKHSGRQLWKTEIGGQNNSTPAVSGEMVFVGSESGNLSALDINTGLTLWHLSTGGPILSSPLVTGGRVYVGSEDGYLYALDAESGNQGWRFKTGGAVKSSPVYADGKIYFGSEDGNLYALSAADGSYLWRLKTQGYVDSSPVVAGAMVYVGSIDNHIYAIDASTGREQWRLRLGDWVESSPVVAEGILYVGCEDGHLYAVDALSGNRLWTAEAGGGVRGAPSVSGSVVYVGTEDGRLLALDRRTGEQRWTFSTDAWIRSAPVVENRVAYFGSGDGYFYALR